MQQSMDYIAADRLAIEKYNSRRRSNTWRLQLHMGPAPYDGDPSSAAVVLLMNNPGYDASSVPQDHTLQFDGWPLAGLHPSVREGFRSWYSRPLGELIRIYGAQCVAQRVAIVQVNPWASMRFDSGLELPSRQWQVEIARKAIGRGAVVVVGRSAPFWQSVLGSAPNLFTARNPLNPTLTRSGVGETAYAAIQSAFEDQRFAKMA